MNKKAQGMSLNVIIVAALGLLVLVILAAIFVGRTGLFTKEISRCSGSCVASQQACSGTYDKIVSGGCDLNSDGKMSDNGFTTKDITDGFCCVSAVKE